MDNQHRKISGYRELTPLEIDRMNRIKALEAEAASLFSEIQEAETEVPIVDQEALRSLALAKTNLQTGFMWFVRAVAKPQSNW